MQCFRDAGLEEKVGNHSFGSSTYIQIKNKKDLSCQFLVLAETDGSGWLCPVQEWVINPKVLLRSIHTWNPLNRQKMGGKRYPEQRKGLGRAEREEKGRKSKGEALIIFCSS